MSQLSSRALQIVKEQSAIDSICFPETMCKMFIINGPRFFSASWNLIKSWLDARTSGKIEVISDRKKWSQKLLEQVDEDELPCDYGGKGFFICSITWAIWSVVSPFAPFQDLHCTP